MKQLREIVLNMAKRCYNEQLFSGTSGNLSALDPRQGLIAITPSGIPYPEMEISDITIINLQGKQIEGIHKPSSEWPLHTALYTGKPEITGIIHTHSTYATACACLRQEIPVITVETLKYIGGAVPVSKFAMNGTPEVGLYALEAMKNSSVCLMANHGTVSVGKTLKEAYLTSVYVETNAKIFLLAKSAGSPVSLI